jgi:gliding motility-associated-like protein
MRPIALRILSLLVLIFSAFFANGQVVAGFTASPTSGCPPLLVSFTNTTSPATGTTYSWDMGNGSGPITLTDPGTSYLTSGTYTVTLTATHGVTSSSHTQIITVYPTPDIHFTASDTAICPGIPVTFSNTTNGGVPGPVTYLWSFGDGYTSTNSAFSHFYSIPGHFNITLNATNANGCPASFTKPTYIHVFTPPVPVFTVNNNHFCHTPGNAVFASAPTGDGPLTYRWTFGDGTLPSLLASPAHSYLSPGNYIAQFRVTDVHGCPDSNSTPGHIIVVNAIAAFTHPDSACLYTSIPFTNTTPGHISSNWSFGDGHNDTGTIGHNIYYSSGNFTVRLITFDGFCYDTVLHILTIHTPASSFTINPIHPCPAPVNTDFSFAGPPGSTVKWDFGDSTFATGNSVSHVYLIDTYLLVKMYLTTNIGCKDTVALPDTVHDIIFRFNYTPLTGCIPLIVNFDLTAVTSYPGKLYHPPVLSQYPYTPYSFLWQFGDGTPNSTGQSPVHTFTAVGEYTVSATFHTNNGCIITKTLDVATGTPPHATFSSPDRHQCFHDNKIKFIRTLVSGPADEYIWQFGEGINGVVLDQSDTFLIDTVIHSFSLPGLFSDTLISLYHGCPDTFIRHDYILIDSPESLGSYTVLCSPINTLLFKDRSMGDDTHVWLFGDGTTSTLDNLLHTYAAPIIYNAQLTTYNIASGCRDTLLIPVNLVKPSVTFSTPDTAICLHDKVTFTTTLSTPAAVYYQWYALGNTSNKVFANLEDTFNVTGTYDIRVVIVDQNLCKDTFTRYHYILVAKPDAHFMASPGTVCWPFPAVFTDTSTDVPGTFFTNFQWAFGDGMTAVSSSPSVSHNFGSPGAYVSTMIVTDNVGCKDTITQALVSVYRPVASFTASTAATCRNIPVTFTSTSSATTAYYWIFGDGATSTLGHPSHSYSVPGSYTVKLVITDTHGCRDTSTHTNAISITNPIASFYLSDSIALCKPFHVHFFNTSTGNASNYWTLGEGSVSSAVNPVSIYSFSGLDTITLIVTDVNGCKDTATNRHVKVYGYAGDFAYGPTAGCAPVTVLFNAGVNNVSSVSSIVWDFRDGTTSLPSLSDTISHTYLFPGAYLPTIVINDNTGCQASSAGVDSIKIGGVIPGFIASPDSACLGNPIILTDTSVSRWSHIAHWRWIFNGVTDTLSPTSVTYTATGTYPIVLHATDDWGCIDSITKNVTVYALPPIIAMPGVLICAGNTANLSDSIAGGIWNSQNTSVAIVGSGTGIVTAIDTGNVDITYSTAVGCMVTTTITVNAFPDAGIITGDSTLCVGSTIILTDTSAGGVWSSDNGNATIASAGPGSVLITGLNQGMDTIRYTVTHVNCVSAVTRLITIYPLPDAGAITGQNIICKGAIITLTDNVTNEKWSSGDTAVATIDSNTGKLTGIGLGTVIISYTTGPTVNGCMNIATFSIAVIAADFTTIVDVDQIKCYGDSDGSAAITLHGGNPPFEYLWSNGSVAPSINNLDTGTYTVFIKETATQCTIADTITITMPDSLLVTTEVKKDICYAGSGSISVIVNGGRAPYQYQWSNNATGSDIGGLSAGKYILSLTDMNGCVKTITVRVEDSTCPSIIIHNAISPNGDGINETWEIEGLQYYPKNTVKVFDKWGDQVFEKENYKNDWGGAWKNGLVPDGTYYYLLKLNARNGNGGDESFTGYLMIKR